jgi:signal transduction histidine kinase/ActR/RegA family two-component response regulator
MPDRQESPAAATWFLGLRARILAISLLPMLLAALVLAIYFSHRSVQEIEAGLQRQGSDLVRRLAEPAAYDLFAGEPVYLKRLLDYERSINLAEAIGVSKNPGGWWLVSGHASLLGEVDDMAEQTSWRHGDLWYFRYAISLDPIMLHDPLSLRVPSERRILGHITAVIRTTGIDQAKSEIITTTFTLLSLLLLAAGLLAWRLSTRLSRPLTDTIQTVTAITEGNLQARIDDQPAGELASLIKGINRMAEDLEHSTRDLEQNVRDATTQLLEQKQAADATTSAKSRFLAAASHDLRQPLHTLLLLVGALRERLSAADPDTNLLTEHIEASAQTMGTLLNTLLDISRLDASSIVARPECFPAQELLEAIERQFTPSAQEKGLFLRVHKTDLNVFSDPALLERVLANLVANAIRYTDHGGILIGVRRVQKDWARFEVRDTGIGIAEEHRERIFEEFFQLDNHERGYGKGLGLGLSIVQRLVRLLGSSIALKSAPGKGSCFMVRAVRCELPPGWGRERVESNSANNRQPMVAFIDDDTHILEAMLALFDQWGIEAATGEDARSVIQDCRQIGRKPDVILSDYRLLDGRTGIEAIAELRAEFGADIPAVLVTGETGADNMQALDASGLPVLHKPLKPAKLRALLGHILKQRPGQESVSS